MAEEQDTTTAGEKAPPMWKQKKKILIVAGIAGLVLCVGAPLGYFVLSSPEPSVEEVDMGKLESEAPVMEGSSDELQLEEGEEALGAILPFDTFLVNLSGGKYIRVQMQLEFETPEIPKKLYIRMVPIRDAIITLLTQQSATGLEDVNGKEKLKKDIQQIVNGQLRKEDVRRVYFTQFVIQ